MDDGQYGCDERTGFVRCDGGLGHCGFAGGVRAQLTRRRSRRTEAYARLIRMVIERIQQFARSAARRFRIAGLEPGRRI